MQHPPSCVKRSSSTRRLARNIHDSITERAELRFPQRFSEEVSQVVGRVDVGNSNSTIFHQFSDVEVTPSDVLGALMMFGIIR